jgi:hypothetical protein
MDDSIPSEMSEIYGTTPARKSLAGSVGAITNEAFDAERT